MSFFSCVFMTNNYIFVTIIIGDTMNTKKLTYLFFTLSMVFLISGGFSSFLINLKEDHQAVLRRMDDVSAIFEGFSTNTSIFEDYRDTLYTDVLGNVYYDTMYVTDEMVKSKLSEYEDIVDDIGKDVKKLDGWCGNVYYPQATVNNMCTNYKDIYEQIRNKIS